jgi:DNA-binding transcriptional MerR regulator
MQQVDVLQAIRQWRQWSSGSVDELAAIGTAFVWTLGLEPLPESTAGDHINRRTIRYYISSGVLDRPEGERRLAIYHYRHLLQLLYIKARQHAGDRLKEIAADLDGRSLDALETLIQQVVPETVPGPVPVDPGEFARPANLEAVLGRWEYLSGRAGRYRPDEPAASHRPTGDHAGTTGEGTRFRAEIDLGDGVWISLPADHPLVSDEDGRELVLRGIRRQLRSYSQGGSPAGREASDV